MLTSELCATTFVSFDSTACGPGYDRIAEITGYTSCAVSTRHYAEAKTTGADGLNFNAAQLGRSGTDQAVFSQMRSAGLLNGNGEIVGAANQALAAQIKFNEQLAQTIDMEKGFATDFAHDLLQGKSAVEALGDALSNLANKLIDLGMNDLISGTSG